jgi:hypothetical protein
MLVLAEAAKALIASGADPDTVTSASDGWRPVDAQVHRAARHAGEVARRGQRVNPEVNGAPVGQSKELMAGVPK